MYAQVAIKPNPLLRNGAYGIVMRGVQKCTRGCSSLRGRNKLPLCCIKLDTATDVLLVGAQFQGCTLEHVTFDNVIASLVGLPPEKVDDWYRAFAMAYTSLDHVHFSDCDLRGGQMEQCTTTYATIENTLVDVSDFSVLEINKQG